MKRAHYVAFIGLMLFAVTAQAADASASLGLGGKLMEVFASILSGFESVLKTAALSLFGILMLVEMGVWTTKKALHEEFNLETFGGQIAWKIIIWGFFMWLMKDSHKIMSAIIDSFFKLGTDSTGLDRLDAVGMLGLGIQTALAILNKADISALDIFKQPLILLTALLAVLMLLAAFTVTAAQLVMAQVESMIVIAAAPILLAFGALSFTRDIATNVMKHALSTGVKILTIYIIAGVMAKIGPAFSDVLIANSEQIFSSPGQLLEVIGVAFLMLLLSFFVPTIASSMLTGSSGLSGTAALGAAMGAAAMAAKTAGGLVSGAAGAAGAAGNAAAGVAAGAGGLAKALGAGYSAGMDMGKSGVGAAAHAAGEVAKHGLGMGVSSVGNAVKGAANSFADKVNNSTGGQIASSIEATRGGSMSGTGSGDSGGGTGGGTGGSAGGDSGASVAPGADASASDSAPASSTAGGGAAPAASSSSGASSGSGSAGSRVAPPSAAGATASATSTSGASSPAKKLEGYTPHDLGNASTASIGGPGGESKPRSTLGKLADAAGSTLGSTGGLMQEGREHILDDRTQVTASIDTRGSL